MMREVVAEIMIRWLTVLMALVAQGMALASPVCFVRCVGADGHECVELLGQSCDCCGCQSQEPPQQVCALSTCCDRCHDQDEEQEAPVGPQIAEQDCSCWHSPMESAPQVQNKSLASDSLIQSLDFILSPMTLDFVSALRALNNASLRQSLLRPDESPQLAALATVVLRV